VRKQFLAMALTAVAIGVLVLVYRGPARELVRGHVGDVAATLLVYALVGLVMARVRVAIRAALTLGIACTIELCQTMYQATTFTGELFLGTTFDGWDLVAYAIGVAIAVAWERRYDARHARRRPGPPGRL
jgi:hypothetical protein